MKKIITNKRRNMNKGFTFAELMISLVIIAVITAILYPTISEISPNNNQYLFKSAYKTIEMVISDIINDSTTAQLPDNDAQELCEEFKARLNTVSQNGGDCVAAGPFELTTSNGMRWRFIKNAADNFYIIFVDVNASNNNMASQCLPAAGGGGGGDVEPYNDSPCGNGANDWSQGCFRLNNETARDTFSIEVNNVGKITVTDTQGQQHLRAVSN